MIDINLELLDYLVIGGYLLITFAIGFLAERFASKGGDAFFLGGRKLPWWALGASGMASNVDISGTMLAVSLIYVMGITGFFVEIRGGIVLVMAILMAFMGKWNRRSGVMTRAEWMIFRFGNGTSGQIARVASAIAEILFVMWVVVYFAVGLETFVAGFIPATVPVWLTAKVVTITIIGFIMIYSMAGGLTGVVWTDVFQAVLILIGVGFICYKAIGVTLPETFAIAVPAEDGVEMVQRSLKDWVWALPPKTGDFPGAYSQYNNYIFFLSILLLKTVIDGLSGSGGYAIQRLLAAKNEREAGLISAVWIFLLMFRWPMVIGFAVLGIALSIDSVGSVQAPEQVLPIVIENVLPVGIRGLLVAAFLAAFMSTLSSFLNSTSAYWVQDIYKPYINKNATQKQEVLQGRLMTAFFVVFGVGIYLFNLGDNLDAIWGWMQAALVAGLGIPYLLRWYWWRFNGFGFALGLLFGNLAALFSLAANQVETINIDQTMMTVISISVSLTACIVGTLMTSPTDDEVLDKFYQKTRPFGIWGRSKAKLPVEEQQSISHENRNEIISMFLALPWQLALFVFPMLLIVKEWGQAAVTGMILLVLTAGLYHFWYKQLSTRHDQDEILEEIKVDS